MKITDNFLEKSELENINKTFRLSDFPWYFMPFKVHEGDDNYRFCHLFLAKGKVLSKFFEILHPQQFLILIQTMVIHYLIKVRRYLVKKIELMNWT